MKLTTKRDRWYFWRELFFYMIPMILIVATVDVFFNFMQCPLHPEYSAPCNIIWINAAGYGFFLVITIIFAIFSARKFKKVKKKIETEFIKATNRSEQSDQEGVIKEKEPEKVEEVEVSTPKKIIAKNDKMAERKTETKKRVTKKSADSKGSTFKKKVTKK